MLFLESGFDLAILGGFRVRFYVWPWTLDTCFPNSTSKRSYVETIFVLLEILCGASGIAAMVITGKEYKSWLSVRCLTAEVVAAELTLISALM